jgi:hypothetical protein
VLVLWSLHFRIDEMFGSAPRSFSPFLFLDGGIDVIASDVPPDVDLWVGAGSPFCLARVTLGELQALLPAMTLASLKVEAATDGGAALGDGVGAAAAAAAGVSCEGGGCAPAPTAGAGCGAGTSSGGCVAVVGAAAPLTANVRGFVPAEEQPPDSAVTTDNLSAGGGASSALTPAVAPDVACTSATAASTAGCRFVERPSSSSCCMVKVRSKEVPY